MAALLALVQDDIKKVLAYSTISQLAYMVAALGMGEAGYPAAMFHLFTHAFFKALLFLGAGSVIHAAHSNNMSDMGGLRKHMKLTYATFVIGSLALAGVPPFAGFFSKDEIILVAKDSQTYWLGAVLLVGAVLTAFYTTRMVLKTFHGEYRGTEHLHESPRSMTAAARVPGGRDVRRRLPRVRSQPVRPSWTGCTSAASPRRRSSARSSPRSRSWRSAIGLLFGYRMYKDYKAVDPITKLGRALHPARAQVLPGRHLLRTASCGRSATRGRPAIYWFNQHVLDAVGERGGERLQGSVRRHHVDRPQRHRRHRQRRGHRDGNLRQGPAHDPDRQGPVVRGRSVRAA